MFIFFLVFYDGSKLTWHFLFSSSSSRTDHRIQFNERMNDQPLSFTFKLNTKRFNTHGK